MNLKFGTDGIRGPVETLITPEACLKIGLSSKIRLAESSPDWLACAHDAIRDNSIRLV